MTRAVSTVLDVTLFLLLVGVAAGTLVAGTAALGPQQTADPDETAALLSTTTAEVEYALTPTEEGAGLTLDRTEGDLFERSAHGTLASLLGDAAVGATRVEGSRLAPATRGFQRRVVERVRARIGAPDEDTQVTAVWTPHGDSEIRGSVTVGPTPPADADLHTAALTVPTAGTGSRARARAAAERDGYGGVARVAANATVAVLLPTDAGQLALRGDFPADALAARRYRRFARAVGADIEVADATLDGTRERLTEALAEAYERRLRDNHESPAAAAEAVSAGEVRVVVRAWSA